MAAWISREDRARACQSEAAPIDAGAKACELGELALWVSLAAVASVLLVSITTHLSQNVAPIPLLWVLPLALYLATFMIAFESDKLYHRGVMFVLLVPIFYYMSRDLYEDCGNLHIRISDPCVFRRACFCAACCATANWRAAGPRRSI